MEQLFKSYIMPHAPILIPEVGGASGVDCKKTTESCASIAAEVVKYAPDVIILTSPHAPCYRDSAVISRSEFLSGDLGRFGHPEKAIVFKNSIKIADEIISICASKNVPIGYLDPELSRKYGDEETLDHGAVVPLLFIAQELESTGKSVHLVHISTPFFTSVQLYELGKSIRAAVSNLGVKAVHIASGDLSHRLTKDGPAGFSPKGAVYDDKLIKIIKTGDKDALLAITEHEMYEAGECGTKSFIIAFGALEGEKFFPEIISYEGPFGVGYLCARLL